MHLQLSRFPAALQADGVERPLAALDAALLAWLALEGPTTRERLAHLLWPDKPLEAARNSLRQRLFKLRQQLGVELVVGTATLGVAPGVGHDLDDAATVLGEAAGEDLAAGEFAAWLDGQRRRHRERQRLALARRADRAEAERDWDVALSAARELLAQDPLSEDAHRRLIRLHYLAGDRAAALLAFDRCEQVLKDEIGARPSAETLALLATVEAAARDVVPVASTRRVPASVLRPPRLIGREAAWRTLNEAWDAGQAVFVRGEAGMGKTRLVTDFARSRGATLVVGARPGDERVVYATASRLLRQLPRSALDALAPGVRAELAQLLPELGPAAGWGSDAQRTRFFNAVTVLLDSPALALEGVVFDDLHFADAASIELCQYVAAQSSRRWLFAGREAELGPAAQALLAALGDGLAPVDLPPLTLAQAAELVESLALDGVDAAALAAPLLQHTGGNPLYMLETLKAWLTQEGIEGALGPAARLPAVRSVSALIERRIGRLSPAAVQLARCAAVATPDFSIELAARVLGVRTLDLADPWAELEAAQVLRDGAFAHDLIYESALASVPAPVARQLHAEIAAFLDAHQGEPARIAHHWLEAGVEARALEALRAAAEAARRAMRKREEIELRDRACAIAERLGRLDDAFDEALVHFEAVMTADRTQVGETLFARLDRLARAPVQRLRSLLAQADFLMSSGRFGEAAPRAEAAADLARGLGDVVREIEALRCAAACASFGGDTQRAVRLLRPALPRVLEQLDDGNDRIGYFGDLACCLDNADQPQEAAEFHRRGLELALQLNRLDLAAVIGGNYSYSLKAAGLVAQAFEQALQAQRYAQTFDDARGAAYHLDVVMLALLRDLGRYDQALRAGEVALQSMAQNPSRAPVVHGHLAWLWLQLGQPARAGQALAAARAETVAPHLRARVTQLEGRLRAALGQKTGAADAFRQAHEEAPATGRVLMQSLIALDHASTLVPESALAQCEAVLQRCASLGYDGAVLTARLRAAEHALRAGDAARSHGHVRAVLAAPSQVVADDIDPAVRWLVAARVLDAVGDTPARDDVLRQGMAWLQHTATQHVPAEFRDGFMERNAVHRELRAMAARQASA